MCGIAGIFNYSGSESPKLDSIIQMTNEMNNRGPDDEGYFLDSGSIQIPLAGPNTPASSKQTIWNPKEPAGSYLQLSSIVSLGHRRLAIQDLTPAGHQPLSTQDGRYWIVFNGEIYNKEEIANELKSLGVQFVGTSDTEVLINAYSSWGERCLSKLNGAFAFSIWDTRNQEMFCARDRLGIKPFYFTNTPTFFMFGSTIRSLLCSGLIKATPDDQGLYLSMAFGIAPRPITAFKNIYALEQSHWMKIKRDGSIIKNRYWEIPTCNQNQEMTLGEAKELLDFELTRSIKSRLLSDVPVGTFMSGGIDSTTVSAIASQFQPDIKAFTLGYEGVSPAMNEVEQASKTASMHNMNHIVNYIKPITSISEIMHWVKLYEEPFYSMAINHIISKIASQNGVKVVLNGLGGDELFAGYSYYKSANMIRSCKGLKSLIIPLLRFSGRNKTRIENVFNASTLDRVHTALFEKTFESERSALFCNQYTQEYNTTEILHDLYVGDRQFTDLCEALSFMDIMNYIGNHHLHRIDQFTMDASIEGRFPFLDHRLVEAAFTIPTKLKIDKSRQKIVLRELARKKIHPDCLSMKKKGFSLPIKQWVDGPLHAFVNESLQKLKDRNIINATTVTKWQHEYQKGKRPVGNLWHLVSLELWFQSFIDHGGLSK